MSLNVRDRSKRNRADRENMIQVCKNPIVEDDFHGSLHRNCEGTEQLLMEALAEAMDRDLADIPPREQLEQQNRFSHKFVRRMKRLETAVEEGREPRVNVDPSDETRRGGRKILDFRKRGAAAKRYSGLAAALVCVIGLAAVAGVMSQSFRMGKSSADEGIAEESAVEDNAGLEFAADETVEEPAADETLEESAAAGEPEAMAPDWQEQLLLESVKADEIVTWHLNTGNGDGSIELVSEVPGQLGSDGQAAGQILRASAVYEVYYEQQPDEWERVYHTDRVMDNYTNYGSWEEWYLPEDLNMTQTGTYRLVRQVNQYRQVLQLTLDER